MVYGRSAYRTTAVLSETFLVRFIELHERSDWRATGLKLTVLTSLIGSQLCMTTKLTLSKELQLSLAIVFLKQTFW